MKKERQRKYKITRKLTQDEITKQVNKLQKGEIMDSYLFQKKCKETLIDYFRTVYNMEIEIEDFYVVWSCKVLQNNKVLISTDKVDDGFYAEFTRNGNKEETYMDIYYKQINKVVNIQMYKIIKKLQTFINSILELNNVYNEIDKIEDEEERQYVKIGLEDGWIKY